MGLDQYAYAAAKSGQQDEWYNGATFDEATKDFINPGATKPVELAYWRKHPNLQGWMEQLWIKKGYPGISSHENKWDSAFNCVELELSWEDIDQLEHDIEQGSVAEMNTTGFFFGNPSDEYYRKQDLEFCRNARAQLFLGLKVFYNSSW